MIVGLFPELLATGGIQRAGRHTAAILAEYAARAGTPARFLSLNDPRGLHWGKAGEYAFEFRGFGRDKAHFVSVALRQVLDRPRLALGAHPNLAPVMWLMGVLAPGIRTMIMTYGMEVWEPLPGLRRWALQRADLVIAPSSDTARHLVGEQGVPEERVRCVPLGLDPEFTSGAATNGAEGKPLGFPNGRMILTVGRQAMSEHFKGVDILIRAMRQLLRSVPDLCLVVIGDGDDRPRLERMTQELCLNSRVRFWGNVPVETLVTAYQRCDVFAMPSKAEGFGLTLLEAMAFGKPVVGGAHGGPLDIIQDGVTGYLVPHGDIDGLVQVLERLLKDKGLRREVGQRAQEQVRSRYMFEHFQARLIIALEEVLRRR
jgi:phosphatidylinositol alpha-1,6-mannosyltransferase